VEYNMREALAILDFECDTEIDPDRLWLKCTGRKRNPFESCDWLTGLRISSQRGGTPLDSIGFNQYTRIKQIDTLVFIFHWSHIEISASVKNEKSRTVVRVAA
jgi:hypothetical protein